MEYEIYSHRHGLTIMKNDPACLPIWNEIIEVIESISDTNIIKLHSREYLLKNKSISTAINALLKKRFTAKNWAYESYIFNDTRYKNKAWRLDFAKESVSLEVGFNHSGSIAWNLMKPVIGSELNHVEKAIQTKIGVIICATNELQVAGGFDNAIGTYEQYIDHLKPLRVQLTTPLVIIGLKKPKDFYIKLYKPLPNKTLGEIILYPSKLKLLNALKKGYILVK